MDGAAGNFGDVSDPAAAAANCHGLTGPNATAHLRSLELTGYGTTDVMQTRRLELLANGGHLWQRDLEPPGHVDFDAGTDHGRTLMLRKNTVANDR
jgi:hypothetical protein